MACRAVKPASFRGGGGVGCAYRGKASEVSEREGLRQAELAIRQAAVSCYALDGAYPASYADLKDRSAIAVDEERYKVFYEIFASNIMPEITVVRRKP